MALRVDGAARRCATGIDRWYEAGPPARFEGVRSVVRVATGGVGTRAEGGASVVDRRVERRRGLFRKAAALGRRRFRPKSGRRFIFSVIIESNYT